MTGIARHDVMSCDRQCHVICDHDVLNHAGVYICLCVCVCVKRGVSIKSGKEGVFFSWSMYKCV